MRVGRPEFGSGLHGLEGGMQPEGLGQVSQFFGREILGLVGLPQEAAAGGLAGGPELQHLTGLEAAEEDPVQGFGGLHSGQGLLPAGLPLQLHVDKPGRQIQDIAGIRVTCSFISDTYRVLDMLTSQEDVTVLEVKDYVTNPKSNGYKSLHLIVAIPVFMSDRVEPVTVEIQIRTVAMDFWASLEHKIFYKYRGVVPANLVAELKEAADVANRLDIQMERLHNQVVALEPAARAGDDLLSIAGLTPFAVPTSLLEAIDRGRASDVTD